MKQHCQLQVDSTVLLSKWIKSFTWGVSKLFLSWRFPIKSIYIFLKNAELVFDLEAFFKWNVKLLWSLLQLKNPPFNQLKESIFLWWYFRDWGGKKHVICFLRRKASTEILWLTLSYLTFIFLSLKKKIIWKGKIWSYHV